MTEVAAFEVSRNDPQTTRVRSTPLPSEIGEGAVLLSIDRFALTANNLTYATFGDALSYWDFFPTGDPAWGAIPAWGFGTVVASRCDGIVAGERFYGYVPMASHLVVHPQRVRPAGFVDGAAHREPLHPLYNQYTRNATDPLYDAARESLQLLLRPLFITSFVIDDLLADNGFHGAQAVLLSSASSKTASGLAHQLSLRRPAGPEVIGWTSARNLATVDGFGCYDRAVAYDALDTLPRDLPIVYVDFAGDADLRAVVHRHFGDALRASLMVGAAHGGVPAPVDHGLPGVRPTAFFAPARIRKRSAEWGADGFAQRFASAWHAFVARVADPERAWMRVVEEKGAPAVERVYRAFLDGVARPDEGRIVSLRV